MTKPTSSKKAAGEADGQTLDAPYLKPAERRLLVGETLFHEGTIRRWEVNDSTLKATTAAAIDAAAIRLNLPLPAGRKRPGRPPRALRSS